MTLLVMTVVSNSWVRAATSYRLGVRWGGMRGGLAPVISCEGRRGEEPSSPERPDTGDSVMARNGSGTPGPKLGIRGEAVVSLVWGDTADRAK